LTNAELVVCSLAERFSVSPSEIRKWSLSDVLLLQRFFEQQARKRDEMKSSDNPANMQLQYG
jgi:hypothetical protein